MKLPVKLLSPWANVPTYANPGDAGMDLYACIMDDCYQSIATIEPNCRLLIKTGVAMAIPEGYELQIRPRSGLALKNGITVLNAPGTIDAGYRNEIGVILFNTGTEPFNVAHGDRIAQGVLAAFETAEFDVVEELPTSQRGMGGFGSTGA